ncbi:hypothetical protein BRD03_13070 [Halobacteriales archaeon QS_9_68_17]|nr:MAG: hypothetical protein BRD03_13070 [Halobacteriales archaeon QS_9_68_17]
MPTCKRCGATNDAESLVRHERDDPLRVHCPDCERRRFWPCSTVRPARWAVTTGATAGRDEKLPIVAFPKLFR